MTISRISSTPWYIFLMLPMFSLCSWCSYTLFLVFLALQTQHSKCSQYTAGVQSSTTRVVYSNENYVAIEKMDKNCNTFCYCSCCVPYCSILISVIAVCTRKKGSMKNTLSKIRKFRKTPSHNFCNGVSCIRNTSDLLILEA